MTLLRPRLLFGDTVMKFAPFEIESIEWDVSMLEILRESY
jgi:hypothetical protein